MILFLMFMASSLATLMRLDLQLPSTKSQLDHRPDHSIAAAFRGSQPPEG
jgi:hypothetical protein